jgi:predicted MFS family arabinose efflux permease
MNVAAVAVTRLLDRPLMPVFHAGFSVGGLLGSIGAALAAAVQWSPLRQFSSLAAIGVIAVALVATSLPADAGERSRTRSGDVVLTGPPPARRTVLWLLALIALCSAVAEGASADWSALFLARDRGVADSLAAAGYAVFSVAMAATRLSGERAERRWDRTNCSSAAHCSRPSDFSRPSQFRSPSSLTSGSRSPVSASPSHSRSR